MVDNLITLAGFFSRQIVLVPEEIDFKDLMRTTFPPLKEIADEKNITFQVDIVGSLSPVREIETCLRMCSTRWCIMP